MRSFVFILLLVAGLAGKVASAQEFPPELAPAYIQGIQTILKAHGFYRGAITGQVDVATGRAIGDYQRAAGLTVTRRADLGLANELNFRSAGIYAPPAQAAKAAPRKSAPPKCIVDAQAPVAASPAPASPAPSTAPPPPDANSTEVAPPAAAGPAPVDGAPAQAVKPLATEPFAPPYSGKS